MEIKILINLLTSKKNYKQTKLFKILFSKFRRKKKIDYIKE